MTAFDPSGLTVYVDGEYVDGTAASIPIWDHGLLYGDGIFEGMRLFGGSLFRPYLTSSASGARPGPSVSSFRSAPRSCST